MADENWGPWIEHVAGDRCPIPDAKAGEYQARDIDGDVYTETDGDDLFWGECGGGTITHYRIRKPPVDWKGIADDLASAIEGVNRWSAEPDERQLAVRTALTRYREAISNNQEKHT